MLLTHPSAREKVLAHPHLYPAIPHLRSTAIARAVSEEKKATKHFLLGNKSESFWRFTLRNQQRDLGFVVLSTLNAPSLLSPSMLRVKKCRTTLWRGRGCDGGSLLFRQSLPFYSGCTSVDPGSPLLDLASLAP